MRGRKSGFILQSLEKRLMFSSTPASPRPDSLGSLFNGTQRQALLNRLTHLDSTTKSTLQSKLNLGKIGAFDSTLLSYMRNRNNTRFYFDAGDAASDASYIVNNNINYLGNVNGANSIADYHLFPD